MKRFLEHPIWSKVIAHFIILFFLLVGGLIYGLTQNISIIDLLLFKINSYWLIVSILAILIVQVALNLTFRKKGADKDMLYDYYSLSEDQKQIQKINQMNFPQLKVLWKYNVRFDNNNKLYVDDLIPYCTNHEINLKMTQGNIGFKCPVCNSSISLMKSGLEASPYQHAQNIIESELENTYEQRIQQIK